LVGLFEAAGFGKQADPEGDAFELAEFFCHEWPLVGEARGLTGDDGEFAGIELLQGIQSQRGIGQFLECSVGDDRLPVGQVLQLLDFETQ